MSIEPVSPGSANNLSGALPAIQAFQEDPGIQIDTTNSTGLTPQDFQNIQTTLINIKNALASLSKIKKELEPYSLTLQQLLTLTNKQGRPLVEALWTFKAIYDGVPKDRILEDFRKNLPGADEKEPKISATTVPALDVAHEAQIRRVLGIAAETTREVLAAKLAGGITLAEAKELGVSDAYARVVDQSMNVRGIGDGTITLEEIQHAEKVIKDYGTTSGIGEDKARLAYQTAKAFKNLNFDTLKQARTTAEGWFAANTSRENLSPKLFSIVSAKTFGNAQDFSKFLVQYALASMTGMNEVFGIDKTVTFEQPYAPPNPTTQTLLDWWKEETWEEEAVTATQYGSISNPETALRKLGKKAKIEDKEAIWNACTEEVKHDAQVSQEIYDSYKSKLESAKQAGDAAATQTYLTKSLEVLSKYVTRDKDRTRAQMADLAIEWAKFGNDNFKPLADQITTAMQEAKISKVNVNGQDKCLPEFNVMVKTWQVKTPELVSIEEATFKTDPQTRETSPLPGVNLEEKAKELDMLIASDAIENKPAQLGYAKLLKARIARAFADKAPSVAEEKIKQVEAQNAYYQAYVALSKCASESFCAEWMEEALNEMCQKVVDYDQKFKNNKKETYRKEMAKQLANIIPGGLTVNKAVKVARGEPWPGEGTATTDEIIKKFGYGANPKPGKGSTPADEAPIMKADGSNGAQKPEGKLKPPKGKNGEGGEKAEEKPTKNPKQSVIDLIDD